MKVAAVTTFPQNDGGQASPVFPYTPGEALRFVRPAARARALEAIIADRIEGKVGTRRGEETPRTRVAGVTCR